jgi:glucosamine-6-phosphate deaminase
VAKPQRRFGRLGVIVLERSQVEREVASEIARIQSAQTRNQRRTVLGFATGKSPIGLYAELIRLHGEGALSSDFLAVQLDEYVGLDPDDPRSFRSWLRRHVVDPLGVQPEALLGPPADLPLELEELGLASFDALLSGLKGMDLLVLGLGRNGHIAFNEPGSERSSRTRRVELAPETREDAAAAWGGLENVPTHAVTLGVATLLESSRVRLLAFGESKREAVQRTLTGPISPEWPASFLRQHNDALLYVDAEAFGSISGDSASFTG